MSDYICRKCQFTYDEAEGDVKNGIEAGTFLKALSHSLCSVCWMNKPTQYQKNDQSYTGLEAQYYAAICGKYNKAAFQTRLANSHLPGKAILEVGVGSGRVAQPLIELGYQVDGLEISQEMLDQLRRQQWTESDDFAVLQGDFFRLRPKKKYDLVYFSDTVFQELTAQASLETVWRRATSFLNDQGEIWLELMIPVKTEWHYTRRKQLTNEKILYIENQGKTDLFTQSIRYATILELFEKRFLAETYRIERDLSLLFPRDIANLLTNGFKLVSADELEKTTIVANEDKNSWVDGGYPLPQTSSEHRTLLIQVKKEEEYDN